VRSVARLIRRLHADETNRAQHNCTVAVQQAAHTAEAVSVAVGDNIVDFSLSVLPLTKSLPVHVEWTAFPPARTSRPNHIVHASSSSAAIGRRSRDANRSVGLRAHAQWLGFRRKSGRRAPACNLVHGAKRKMRNGRRWLGKGLFGVGRSRVDPALTRVHCR